ncbi:MAG: 3-oxoacyl-ACP reductase FabG [Deinococcales bacterium]
MTHQAPDRRAALVTGGARGIGRAIVETLAREGWELAVNDIDPAALEECVERLGEQGVRVFAVPGDVASEDDAGSIADTVAAALGRLDALVNNAGIGGTGTPLAELSLAEWSRMLQVDLTGVFLMVRACLPHLTRGGGRIVNIASISAFTGVAGSTHYCAAKAGVIGLTRALAHELAADGITVNAVAPGVIDTAMARRRGIDHQSQRILLSRLGIPEDVASAVAFLLSSGAEFMTGHVMHVNGGAYM